MAQLDAMDEYLIHQIPDILAKSSVHHHHWRESYFYELHDPNGTLDDDFFAFSMAVHPGRNRVDTIQQGRIAGQQVLRVADREYDGDAFNNKVGGAEVQIIKPWEEIRVTVDPEVAPFGLDVTFHARTAPYALRRGTMRAGSELIWDQAHILQSGTYTGEIIIGDERRSVDGWVGQRDHSMGLRNHGRCPLWLWFQIQFDDGCLSVWHWELENGAVVYTDGFWAPTDKSEPTPLVGFRNGMIWVDADGNPADYGQHGENVAGLAGTCEFTLAGGKTIVVEGNGSFARPYEPHHRGGLNLMHVRADDGRTATAVYEVTGARHHRYFPECEVPGPLPS